MSLRMKWSLHEALMSVFGFTILMFLFAIVLMSHNPICQIGQAIVLLAILPPLIYRWRQFYAMYGIHTVTDKDGLYRVEIGHRQAFIDRFNNYTSQPEGITRVDPGVSTVKDVLLGADGRRLVMISPQDAYIVDANVEWIKGAILLGNGMVVTGSSKQHLVNYETILAHSDNYQTYLPLISGCRKRDLHIAFNGELKYEVPS